MARAIFDFSTADATATVQLAPSPTYVIDFTLRISPSVTVAQMGDDCDPNILEFEGGVAGVFIDSGGVGVPPGWFAFGGASDSGGAVATAGVDIGVHAELTYSSGTLWDIAYVVDGVSLSTLGVDLGHDASVGISMTVGAADTGHLPGFYVEISSVVVTDGSSPIFTDPMDTDFSLWDSTDGAASIGTPPALPWSWALGSTTIFNTAAHPPVLWRWVICDKAGVPISIITSLMDEVSITFALNRPATLSFSVPSEHPLVNILHTDDEPYLSCGNRVIKGYRKVSTAADITPGGWELAYVGRTWIVNDEGDGATVRTSVTCYDPLIDLAKRICRNADGTFLGPVVFTAQTAGDILQALITAAETFGESETMIGLGGAFTDVATFSEAYDLQYILPTIIALTDTGLADIIPTYLDSEITTVPHKHLQLGMAAERGTDKSASVILGYDAPPRTADTYSRTQSMEDFANDVTLFPNDRSLGRFHDHDATSVTKYDSFESVDVLTGITDSALLNDLGAEQLTLRKQIKDLVTIIPAPEISAQPITDWDCGDRITVNAARTPNPSTRQTVTGIQRIYQYTLEIDPDYGEHVTEMVLSAAAETS